MTPTVMAQVRVRVSARVKTGMIAKVRATVRARVGVTDTMYGCTDADKVHIRCRCGADKSTGHMGMHGFDGRARCRWLHEWGCPGSCWGMGSHMWVPMFVYPSARIQVYVKEYGCGRACDADTSMCNGRVQVTRHRYRDHSYRYRGTVTGTEAQVQVQRPQLQVPRHSYRHVHEENPH